jgi:hypothetical protein
MSAEVISLLPNKALKQSVGVTVFSAANGRILRSQQPPAA